MSTNDQQAIADVIQVYFDCMYESDADKAHAAFHPNARITGYLNGDLAEMSVADFAGFVASQPSAKEAGAPARLDILSCEIAGDTAVTRVRDDYIGLTFLDTLSLLRVGDEWKIYNKLFHVEGPAA